MLGVRVRRVVTAATLFLAVVCIPAAPVLADLGDTDPGTATTSTTLESTPPTEPSSTTSTTSISSDPSTDPSSTTTTTTPDDAVSPVAGGATTTSTSPSTAPTDPSTTSTTLQSSGGRGRSTTTTRPSSSTPTTAPTTTTAPALPPAEAAVTNDAAGASATGGDAGGASAGTSPSGGSARTTRPSPTRPGKDSETNAEIPPDPNWFDASGLSGLLGVGTGADSGAAPAGETPGSAPTELASALPSRDHASSPSSAVLLGLSLLILLALAGGAAFRWWDQRPDRYWSA